jgi:hypothetical protein
VYYSWRGFLIFCGVFTIVALIAAALEWINRRTDSPIMRKRVNNASDTYFQSRGSVWEAGLRDAVFLFDRVLGTRKRLPPED